MLLPLLPLLDFAAPAALALEARDQMMIVAAWFQFGRSVRGTRLTLALTLGTGKIRKAEGASERSSSLTSIGGASYSTITTTTIKCSLLPTLVFLFFLIMLLLFFSYRFSPPIPLSTSHNTSIRTRISNCNYNCNCNCFRLVDKN
ncbi:hypothetical protein FRC20_000232 [Serendipita sp. 405]|nr:hypothetical protein FRC20_000232 [Serendipita sp. 405]